MKNTLLPLFAYLLCNALCAQNNTREGWIINLQNDTIRGVARDKAGMDQRFSFKPASAADFQEFSPTSIKAFYYEGGYYYKSVEIPGDAGKPERLFLLCLVEGPLSLYRHKDFFYLEKPAGVMTKLEKKDARDGNYLREDKKYIGILTYLTADCEDVKGRVEKTKFEAGDLAKTVAAYNTCINPAARSSVNTKPLRTRIQKGVRVGAVVSNVDFFLDLSTYKDFEFNTKTGYTAGVFCNFAFGRGFLVQPELLLTKKGGTYEGRLSTVSQGKVDVDATYLQLPISLYYMLPGQKVRPFVSAGGVVGYAVSLKAQQTDSDSGIELPIELDKGEYGFRGGAGLSYFWTAKRQLGLEYVFERSLTNKFAGTNQLRHLTHHISLRITI